MSYLLGRIYISIGSTTYASGRVRYFARVEGRTNENKIVFASQRNEYEGLGGAEGYASQVKNSLIYPIALAGQGLIPLGEGLSNVYLDEIDAANIYVMGDTVPSSFDPCGNPIDFLSIPRARARQLADKLMLLGSIKAVFGDIGEGDANAFGAEVMNSVAGGLAPREYLPVSVQADEDAKSTFVEPGISATYYDCVNLRVGGEWAVADFSGGKLYYCSVKSRSRPGPGLITYTFVTPMTLLNHTEPPSLIVAAGDEGVEFGADATPKEALEQVILPHFQKLLPQLTWGEIPEFRIRTGSVGQQVYTVPTVPVVHLVQEQNPRSIREFLESILAPFQGYTYRMDGWQLQIIAPAWAQASPVVTTLTDDNLISLLSAENDETIINTQKVVYRPWEFLGDFEDPDSLEPITEPAYYRVGFTEELGPPDNRRLLKDGKAAPWALNMAAKKDKVLVTWTAYVFGFVTGTVLGEAVENGQVDTSGKIQKAVHTFEMTKEGYYIAETLVSIYINKGNGGVPDFFGGELRNQFARSDGVEPEGNYVKFRWRLQMKNSGVTATLEYPSPETVFTWHAHGESQGYVLGDFDVKVGAEFHLDVRGVTFQQSPITYSATYGVQVPSVGVEPDDGSEPFTEVLFGKVPTKEDDYVEDPEIKASYDLYGRREGSEIAIEVWTLTLPTERDAVGEPIIDWNADYEADILASLTGIAETVVKNRINPSQEYALELSAPFLLAPPLIATSVALPDGSVGDLNRISYGEAHAPGSVQLSATGAVIVRELGEIHRFNQPPGTPPEPEENELPVPLPPDGPVTEDPNPPNPYTVDGAQEIPFTRPFVLMAITGPNGARLRLFRDEATRTADASRDADTRPDEVNLPNIITDETIEAGGRIDLHAVIAHTPGETIYALAEGGAVTLEVYDLNGRKR